MRVLCRSEVSFHLHWAHGRSRGTQVVHRRLCQNITTAPKGGRREGEKQLLPKGGWEGCNTQGRPLSFSPCGCTSFFAALSLEWRCFLPFDCAAFPPLFTRPLFPCGWCCFSPCFFGVVLPLFLLLSGGGAFHLSHCGWCCFFPVNRNNNNVLLDNNKGEGGKQYHFKGWKKAAPQNGESHATHNTRGEPQPRPKTRGGKEAPSKGEEGETHRHTNGGEKRVHHPRGKSVTPPKRREGKSTTALTEEEKAAKGAAFPLTLGRCCFLPSLLLLVGGAAFFIIFLDGAFFLLSFRLVVLSPFFPVG